MYASSFSYYRAGSVSEARELLRAHPGAKILAGGHSLIPLLKLRLAAPTALVDIGRVSELKGIGLSGGVVRIGALTTHAEIASSPVVRQHVPALAEAAAHVGDPAVRNRGTIGGNVSHADPASDLPTVLTACGARFVVQGAAGSRTIAAEDFFTGLMTTALGEQDVLTGVEVPTSDLRPPTSDAVGMAYVKFVHPASRYAVIGVAAVLTVQGGTCSAARVALGGLVPKPARSTSVERAVEGQSLSADVIARAASAVSADLGSDVLGDLYASAEYRRAVAPVWVKRALARAAERAA
jgi:carbon-monoxide dehydrogenase medium subunit